MPMSVDLAVLSTTLFFLVSSLLDFYMFRITVHQFHLTDRWPDLFPREFAIIKQNSFFSDNKKNQFQSNKLSPNNDIITSSFETDMTFILLMKSFISTKYNNIYIASKLHFWLDSTWNILLQVWKVI